MAPHSTRAIVAGDVSGTHSCSESSTRQPCRGHRGHASLQPGATLIKSHAQRGFAAWSVETDALALRIQAATGSVDAAEVAAVRDRAERIGATAVLRRLRATGLVHHLLDEAADAPSDRGSR
ncbi:hypothetical protein [Rhodococcus sp. 14-2483-1-2]|uniref:hypothetical protein n=1 Tax=Rhodococcus sp. 14-2483-1-2 TaxID=2023147 RepID=UPI000B9C6B4C|nr:hypothetical protein [Rhodococcus sp. 14-2483-1-2]OZF39579.1 hypothetical protein CH295_02385 [Rhodococcus sp. 14-2483-1-2]